jgi:hypothetical protein
LKVSDLAFGKVIKGTITRKGIYRQRKLSDLKKSVLNGESKDNIKRDRYG